jgi:hypothetical protein
LGVHVALPQLLLLLRSLTVAACLAIVFVVSRRGQ